MKQGEIWLIDLDPAKGSEMQKKDPQLSAADCFQVRSLSVERFIKKLGSVEGLVSEAIKKIRLKRYSHKVK